MTIPITNKKDNLFISEEAIDLLDHIGEILAEEFMESTRQDDDKEDQE